MTDCLFVAKRRSGIHFSQRGSGPIIIREARPDEISTGIAMPLADAFRKAKKGAKWTREIPEEGAT